MPNGFPQPGSGGGRWRVYDLVNEAGRGPVLVRPPGAAPTERRLNRLARGRCLGLWSHGALYRHTGAGDGSLTTVRRSSNGAAARAPRVIAVGV